jgi:hypothetical protein
MKKFIVLLGFMFLIHGISAQSLLDIYKKGVVKLTPDTEYGRGNDWEKVFAAYLGETPTHNRSMVMMPNGSVVVSYSRNAHPFYTMFDANGKFVKEFGITNSSGRRLKHVHRIEGVINNHFFTDGDNMGNIKFLDFSGNLVKTMTVDWGTLEMISMTNNKIAVVGHAVGGNRSRYLVAILDYQTNQEKIIWNSFVDNKPDVQFTSGTMMYSFGGNNVRPNIAFANNQLIVALPHSGEILFYDVNGTLKSKQKVDWQQKILSVAEQKENEKNAIERAITRRKEMQDSKESKERLQVMDDLIQARRANLENITEQKPLPMFANVIQDSDGNLLFFEVPEKEGANQFNVWVFQNGGQFVAKSSFVAEGFDLSITPSRMIFHKGHIYALTIQKNASGNPLRLVRFKVGN